MVKSLTEMAAEIVACAAGDMCYVGCRDGGSAQKGI